MELLPEARRDWFAFVTSAARNGRKEVFERLMSLEERMLLDPAKQKEINNYIVGDVLAKFELHGKTTKRTHLEHAMGSGVSSG